MKGPGISLDGGGGSGVGVGTPLFQTAHLPAQVTDVSREVVRAFSHNKRVGTYLLGRSLGEGSFAKVKEALHLPTGIKVAVKVIDKKRAKADPYVRKNLRREGRLLQQIRHQHVVQLMEVLETEHSYYLVTEHCGGGDLMDYIAKRKRLDEREVKKFIRQIVSAVDYLHRLGIIHRDLKIENLLLDQNRDIKIIDFGLSNTIKVNTAPEGTAHAQEYLVTQCGSPAYAAPELLNHRKYGLQVDVWSIGVNMYAMLTGSLPFTVDPFNIKTLYNKMVSGQMNPVPDGLSREGKDILRRLLTADPENRLTIAEALRHPWLSEGRNKPVERHPFPNKLKTSDLDTDILKHMSDNLGYRMSEIIRFVVGNVPSSACATYHLYHRKLERHRAEQRSQGKAPAETKPSMEPTRISLVLQDMTPRVTNPGAPTRALRTRGDSFEKDILTSRDTHAQNGHRRSLEKSRTVTTTPSTDKDSIVGKERTFLSSQEHSLEDIRADTKENKRTGQSYSKPSSSSTPKPDRSVSSPRHLLAPGRTFVKTSHVQPGAAYNHKHDAGTPRQLKATPADTARSTAASTSSSATTASSAYSHGLSDSPRKGRVLVPLSRTFGALRRGAGVRAPGGSVMLSHDSQQVSATSGKGSHSRDGSSGGGGGTRVLRATYPVTPPTHGSSPAPASSTNHGHVIRQAVAATAKRTTNTQWRSPAPKTECGVSSSLASRLAPPDAHVAAKLAPHDAHSKRPVSPQALPLVRRRLAKRSRQDGHGPGQFLEGQAPVEKKEQEDDENVTVERLVTSPDCRVTTRTPVSQSGSSTARDLHTLPAISALGTPRQ